MDFAKFFDFTGVPATAVVTLLSVVLEAGLLALCGTAFIGLLTLAGVAAGMRVKPGIVFEGVISAFGIAGAFFGVAIAAAAVLPGPLNAAPMERVLIVSGPTTFSLPTSLEATCLAAAILSLFICARIGPPGRHRGTPGVGCAWGDVTEA